MQYNYAISSAFFSNKISKYYGTKPISKYFGLLKFEKKPCAKINTREIKRYPMREN